MTMEQQPNGDDLLVLGVDVGGTFTDGLLLDRGTGELRSAKVPTTADDQSIGTVATLEDVGISASELGAFCHGTTVGINALLQRRGAMVGLICSEGMRDLLDIGQFTRSPEGLYDPTWKRPHQARPIVQRRHIREMSGRRLYDGSVHVPFDDDEVRSAVEFLRTEGVEAIGVCLLHAYVDLEDEQRIIEIVREVIPGCYVQSSAVRPVVGEYNRTTAVVLDAYTGPVVARYLRKLQDRLLEAGYSGPAVIMQMNGGVKSLERTAEDFPAYTMLSGPVAGVLGAEYYAQSFVGVENLVCVDIGGTSTDLGLIIDGAAEVVSEWEAEWKLPLGVPSVDVRSIGAGGGSLIQTDEMGTLRVGPESAGADPGPACYGRGATIPTVTDAHIVLGTIRSERLLAGRMVLDVDAARRAIGQLAERLEMDPTRLASGAVQLMNVNIETEISTMIFERGLDVRRFSLFSYGGAGPLHAVDVARSPGIREVVVPRIAGGFAALGLATAPPRIDRALSRIASLDEFSPRDLTEIFDSLEEDAVRELAAQSVTADDIGITRSLSAMYTGQGVSNDLTLDEWPLTGEVVERWKQRFGELYERLYGFSAPEMGITVTTLTVSATGPQRTMALPQRPTGGEEPHADALVAEQEAVLSGRPGLTRFYDATRLISGNHIHGPAVIEEQMTTIVIPEACMARIDTYGNVRIDVT